jgi:hypothetical protein
MNLRQLKNRVGTNFKLRPPPIAHDSDGRVLGALDGHWRLDSVVDKPPRLSFTYSTGQTIELFGDSIHGFTYPDFLVLKCEVAVTPNAVRIEPHLTRATNPEVLVRSYQRPGGEYCYGVAVEGLPEDVRAFMTYMRQQIGPFTSTGVETSRVGVKDSKRIKVQPWSQMSFIYRGRSAPAILETLALKHSVRFTHFSA